jgi:glutamine amidotransferase
MLCVIPPNTIPSRDKLENSALNNPHGFGYAIAVPKEARIHTFRTMNADECINKFYEDRARYADGYAIWHARYATHGSTTLDNCHPFQVGKDEQTYLAHNGIINVIENPQEKRSDTRIFAEDLLPAIGGVRSLDNPQVWNMLEDFTTGSKVAVLTVNPKAKHQLYLLHEEKGLTDTDKVWWSNNTCYLTSWYQSGLSAVAGMVEVDEEEWLMCGVCDEVADYWDALSQGSQDYCWKCGSCYECRSLKESCLCYNKSEYEKAYDYHTYTEKYNTDKYGGWYL